jgi:hypothetical protein
MSVLILEGVTGAGKTSTIKALQGIAAFELINEETTFDNFMNDFSADPSTASCHAHDRMAVILDRIEAADRSRHYLLERFHFSELALGSEWKWYRDIDERCAVLRCKVVVLMLPDSKLASRALYRAEYNLTDWQHLIPRYGSREQALDAIRRAQLARIDATKQSRLQHWTVDTSEAAWDQYAVEIANVMGWTTRDPNP